MPMCVELHDKGVDEKMSMKSNASDPLKLKAAFILGEGDRFHSILVSDVVHFNVHPPAEAVINIFVIRRASGLYEIVNESKTFSRKQCVSRNINANAGIIKNATDIEIEKVQEKFTLAILKESGITLKWSILDLTNTRDIYEQFILIKEWGKADLLSIYPLELICLKRAEQAEV